MSNLYDEIFEELKRVKQVNNKDQMITSLEKLSAITKRMVMSR